MKKSMAKNVLQAVREDGASTLCELRGRGIEVLGLELTQGELISLVDYARRQGHLEPLASTSRADGSHSDTPEWAVTDVGRKQLTGLAAWVAANVNGVVPVTVSVISALGVAA